MACKSSEVNLHRYGARKDVLACQENDCYLLTITRTRKNCEGTYLNEYLWTSASIQAFSEDSMTAKHLFCARCSVKISS